MFKIPAPIKFLIFIWRHLLFIDIVVCFVTISCLHDWFICFMQKSSAIISELSLSRGCFFFQLTFFRLSRDNLKIRHLGEEFLQTFYRISNFNTKFFGAIYLYLQKDSGTLYTSYISLMSSRPKKSSYFTISKQYSD